MAEDTVWKPIETVPGGKKVMAYSRHQGIKIMIKYGDDWYDDNEFFDDSEVEWELWTELPPLPGTKNECSCADEIDQCSHCQEMKHGV